MYLLSCLNTPFPCCSGCLCYLAVMDSMGGELHRNTSVGASVLRQRFWTALLLLPFQSAQPETPKLTLTPFTLGTGNQHGHKGPLGAALALPSISCPPRPWTGEDISAAPLHCFASAPPLSTIGLSQCHPCPIAVPHSCPIAAPQPTHSRSSAHSSASSISVLSC